MTLYWNIRYTTLIAKKNAVKILEADASYLMSMFSALKGIEHVLNVPYTKNQNVFFHFIERSYKSFYALNALELCVQLTIDEDFSCFS
jgi:hypothetical protein